MMQPQFGQQPFMMMQPQPGVDLSFDGLSPQLPAVFEYNRFKYIDTARVEPRIAYSPEKTPPKTPETPHFGQNPFPKPMHDETNFMGINQVILMIHLAKIMLILRHIWSCMVGYPRWVSNSCRLDVNLACNLHDHPDS